MTSRMDSQLDPFLRAEREKEAMLTEYFLRGEIVCICDEVLAEEIGAIAASRRLSNLGLQLIGSRDEAFMRFDGIASETDHLPVDRERHNWSAEALEEKDREIEQVEAFYKESVDAACRKLIERFDIKVGR